jgi:hypothetical protein
MYQQSAGTTTLQSPILTYKSEVVEVSAMAPGFIASLLQGNQPAGATGDLLSLKLSDGTPKVTVGSGFASEAPA